VERWKRYASTFVTFTVTFRKASEECAKDRESQTKWMPFDVVELRENSADVDGKTPANESPSYSENQNNEFIPEKKT